MKTRQIFDYTKMMWLFALALLFSCIGNTENGDTVSPPETVAEARQQMKKLKADYDAGKISASTYELRMAELTDEAARLKLKENNLEEALELPGWAREIGLSAPVDMTLVPSFSHQAREDMPGEGFNAVTLVYDGDYETAMREAARIAEEAGVPVSPGWQKNYEMNKRLGNPEIRGKVYMNYDFGMDQNVDYFLTIEVTESGRLTISAADARGMKAIINRHTLDPESIEGN